jgi:L-seryl-tRNA(Ser) seleniumtransferase
VGPDLGSFAQVAHRHQLPVIVDAANQVPPLDNLKRFVAEGADLVAMSGGKAFRGPQSSGFLCGRRDLVASALLQQLDMDVSPSAWAPPKEFVHQPLHGVPRHGFGRGFKVGKEEIAGAVAALDVFVTQEPEYQRQWSERCRRFAASVADVGGVETVILGRETTGRVPLVEIVFPTPAKAATISRELREGMPSIHVNERRVGEGRLTFNPVGLDGGQEDVVADALRRLLGAGPAR